MGCGSSRGDVIKSGSSEDSTKKKDKGGKANGKSSTANGNTIDGGGGDKDGKDSLNSNFSDASTIPASEKYENGTDNSKSGGGNPLGKLPPLKAPRSGKVGFLDQRSDSGDSQSRRHIPPVAFEVPAEEAEGNDSSLIKRHPPRRLRKMVEEQPEEPPAVTHESLHDKVQQANERRNQVLTQRVASARQKSARVHKPLFGSGGFIPDYGGEIETAERDEVNGADYL